MRKSILRNARVRGAARAVPGLSPAYHGVRRRLIRARGTARLDYPGARVRIKTDTAEIVKMRITPVAKEPWTVDWIERNLRAGDVLYDIGANVGVYALIAAAFEPEAHVLAFEPGYATFASLCENVQLNGQDARVTPLPVALGERTRLGSLALRDTVAGAAIHALDGLGGVYDQPVLVASLDDLVEQFSLPAPTLVKLDVDGGEGAVLAGARGLLRRRELRSVIVEVETDQTDAVLRELDDAGFELTSRIDEREGQPLPGVWYGTFARPNGAA